MRFHIHPPTAEADAFGFETQSLLNGRIAAEFDFSSCTEHSLPRQSKAVSKDSGNLACRTWKARCSRYPAIGRDFSWRDRSDGLLDTLTPIRSDLTRGRFLPLAWQVESGLSHCFFTERFESFVLGIVNVENR